MSDLPPLTDPDDDALLDREKLSDLERQLVDEFRPPTEDPAPSDSSVSEEVDEASGGGAGETPPPDLPDEPAAEVDDTTPVDAATREVLDNWDNWSADERETAVGLFNWYGTLDPDAIAQIDAATSGNYTLVPNDQLSELQANMDLLQRVRSGEWQAPGSTEPVDDDDIPPQIRLQMEAQEREIEQLKTLHARDTVDAQIQRSAEQIEVAETLWRGRHPELTDDEFAEIQQWVLASGQFAGQSQQFGEQQAVVNLYDRALRQNPAYMQRQIDERVQAELDKRLSPLQEAQARGTRATAVSGAASSAPDLSSMDPDEAMVEEIRRAMQQN